MIQGEVNCARSFISFAASLLVLYVATRRKCFDYRRDQPIQLLNEDVIPFVVHINDSDLNALQRKLESTRWPEPETVSDQSQGVKLDFARELAIYWKNYYHWRSRERLLNKVQHFKTHILGLDIHFIHARSPHSEAFPLLLTHGWPSSIVECMRVVGPLTNPTSHGSFSNEAFHIVCPSLPGFAFSSKPNTPGWNVAKIALAWDVLMKRLGYERYGAQGGDWGAQITKSVAAVNSTGCIAIHLSSTLCKSRITDGFLSNIMSMGYFLEQSTRPQTIGYGLVDSPIAQMVWIVEKMIEWSDTRNDWLIESRDDLLDNVMLYWLTASGASSARLYWEFLQNPVTQMFTKLPTGVTHFKLDPLFEGTKESCREHFNLSYWASANRGGHFGAFEQPQIFVNQMRSFFGSFRT